jgi:hypothetical protein
MTLPNLTWEEVMDVDRRTALVVGLAGASALLLRTPPSAMAADAKEVAPGVTLKVLKQKGMSRSMLK